jgi:periplasmic protein TonB
MRMTQALLASLLIHLVIIFLFFYKNQFLIHPAQSSGKKELLLANFQTIASQPKRAMDTIKNPPQKPREQEVKKEELPEKKPKIKTIQKPHPKVTKKIPIKQNYGVSSPLANALLKESKSYTNPKPTVDQKIRELYGTSFDKFTPTQKKFIKDNLDKIHYITQMTLTQNGYPEAALQTMQQGVNVVSFDLHPNGDITNLRLIRRMGYAILDRNTLEVIKIAYKNYPKPKTTTKIIFNVEYRINPY